jgi:hypothetical protein
MIALDECVEGAGADCEVGALIGAMQKWIDHQ